MGMERSVGKKRVESTGASAIQSAELVLRWFRSDTKRLRAGFNKFNQLPAIWEWNDQWARSELKALGLLQSNRLSWSYDGSDLIPNDCAPDLINSINFLPYGNGTISGQEAS